MTVLTISHSDWEQLEDVAPGSAVFSPISSTRFDISVAMGDRIGIFSVFGTFTNPAGMTVSQWLNSASGTVKTITFSIDGVQQLNASGLAIAVSQLIDEGSDKVHDIIELAIGDKATISGSDDNDHISGNGGDDSISGGNGNDDLLGDLGDDSLNGGNGADTLNGGAGDDSLFGGYGNDSLSGSSGLDKLNGGAGNDALSGGDGNDIYYCDSDSDTISESSLASGGYDTEYASASESGLAANVEKLVLTGSAVKGVGNAGNNAILGNSVSNYLHGGSGNDLVSGGVGDDSCLGGSGGDRLVGGGGKDAIYGGVDSVRDIFDFDALSDSKVGAAYRDKVYNFVSGTDDIDLSTIDAKALATDGGFNDKFAFNGTTAKAYCVWYLKGDLDADGLVDDVLVRADVNGNTVADLEIALIGTNSVSATDFVL